MTIGPFRAGSSRFLFQRGIKALASFWWEGARKAVKKDVVGWVVGDCCC